ncbi:MAG TPA: replication-associated recombination protein A [Candidatus Omnitrophota bacterium]|nr:replication-associated recombination protein A [Candidatus Omnitrophota bacterium]
MKKKTTPVQPEDLFKEQEQAATLQSYPLSVRMRPGEPKDIVGQEHILGEGKLLTRALQSDRLSSIILYGPPGTGKTTIANCICKRTRGHFERINAVSSNVDELRRIIAAAQHRRRTSGARTVLFIDEIHRFNKAQQDVLMPDLEDGNVILIGATVFNPFFSLTGPLISRSLVFELRPLRRENILELLKRALSDKERGLGNIPIKAEEEALNFLAEICDGDARRALNALEIGCLTTPPEEDGTILFTIEAAQESIQKKQVNYDRDGDAHYDTASAFIKSMRGSDPDAALYWMAKMLYAGEDPRFVARRICICAAEDVGNADPQALVLANAALQISEFIGLPEARIPLAQAAVYVACAPKSNAAYMGLEKATADVRDKKLEQVPQHLKDASYRSAKKLDRGKDYKYAHDYDEHYVEQAYMPHKATYYEPTDLGAEKQIKERLTRLRNRPTEK